MVREEKLIKKRKMYFNRNKKKELITKKWELTKKKKWELIKNTKG